MGLWEGLGDAVHRHGHADHVCPHLRELLECVFCFVVKSSNTLMYIAPLLATVGYVEPSLDHGTRNL